MKKKPDTVRIVIPIKPISANVAWSGRRFKSKTYKQFESDVSKLLPFCKNTIKGEVEVSYVFHIKNYKMTDVDNCIKQIQDLIVKRGYIEDDRKIVKFTAQKAQSYVETILIEIKTI